MPVTENSAKAILAAVAPTAVVQASSPANTQMGSWIPPRQIWVGGVSAIVAWLILNILAHFGLDIGAILQPLGFDPGTVQGWLAGAIGAGIAWIVPPAVRDIIQHLDDKIVQIAQKDPVSNVSYVLAPVQPPAGQAAVIVPPAEKI